jgi:glycosyltransferase involved in cell wall biosynthesis
MIEFESLFSETWVSVNVALIMHELLVEGGGERQCLCLARALSEQGHEVVLYTSAYDRESCFPDICKDLRIHDVGRGRLPWLHKPRFFRGYLDMAHLAAAVQEKHEIWNPHHWPAQWGAVWLKMRLGGKVVWMCNDVPVFHDKAKQQSSVRGALQALVQRLFYLYDRAQNRSVDLTLFLSRWAESKFRLIYPGKTCVVRSGADPSRFRPGGNRVHIRDRFGYKPDDFVLLWIGIFMPHRRLQDAIEALALLKERRLKCKLLLAGSAEGFPEYLDSLKALAQDRGVNEDVVFPGKVADEEMRDFYCACDAFIFPNENQTWGLAVLEAMSCGCAVLVSEGAAVSEVLADNENAMLFPARNPDALAKQITKLVSEPGLRSAIAERGAELVRTKYNWEQFGLQVSRSFDAVSHPETVLPDQLHQEVTTER